MTTGSGRGHGGQGLALRIAYRLPEPLLASPERVLLNVACAMIGVAGFFPPEGSPLLRWPDWLVLQWSVTMIFGAVVSLHGTWTGNRVSERAGALAIVLACGLYGAHLIEEYGTGRLISGLIFIFLALAKFVRFLRSVAGEQRRAQGLDTEGYGGG